MALAALALVVFGAYDSYPIGEYQFLIFQVYFEVDVGRLLLAVLFCRFRDRALVFERVLSPGTPKCTFGTVPSRQRTNEGRTLKIDSLLVLNAHASCPAARRQNSTQQSPGPG